MMEYSDEQTISFIGMYRECSFLWDPIDSLYKNRNKSHDGLIKIAVSFGIGKCDVKKIKKYLLPKKTKVNSTYAVSVPIIDEAVNLLRTIQSNSKKIY